MQMEIVNFDQQPQSSYAVALFDIYLGSVLGMYLRRFRLCKSKSGHFFIQSPSYKKGEFEGKAQFSPYVDFNQERGKDFNTAVLALLKPSIEKLKIS